MNGGRLSDDAAFEEGARLLRDVLSPVPNGDQENAKRALRMIAMRYPEEAEELSELLAANAAASCLRALAQMEDRYRADSAD